MMNVPWVEKYRPDNFDTIILNEDNKILIEHMIEKDNMYNLILYGPPGTGKTTTVMNIIKKYNEKKKYKSNVIHLNASDERGIEIIRNNIYQFVNSKSMFKDTKKFIILDEVDYMTKNAQFALQYILKEHNNTHFCLICNYISKIIPPIRDKLMVIQFSNLLPCKIINYLKIICKKENIPINEKKLVSIQKYYNSDIRGMINFLQSNYNNPIFDTILFYNIYNKLKNKKIKKKYIEDKIKKLNISKSEFIMMFLKLGIQERLFNMEIIEKFQIILHHHLDEKYLIETFIDIDY